jgi:hypothetical protein
MSSGPNYNGRQPNNTAYIKNFVYGNPANLWKTTKYQTESGMYEPVITTAFPQYPNLYIPGN